MVHSNRSQSSTKWQPRVTINILGSKIELGILTRARAEGFLTNKAWLTIIRQFYQLVDLQSARAGEWSGDFLVISNNWKKWIRNQFSKTSSKLCFACFGICKILARLNYIFNFGKLMPLVYGKHREIADFSFPKISILALFYKRAKYCPISCSKKKRIYNQIIQN